MITLTYREQKLLALALSNLGDVQTHIKGRTAELLALAQTLGIEQYLTKSLMKSLAARRTDAAAVGTDGGAH